MKKFINVLATALLVINLTAAPELATTASAAPIGNPFGRGYTSPGQLADAIEADLKQQSGADRYVDPQRCAKDGSCATPNDYLAMFKKNDPHSKLASAADLPSYLRTLVSVKAPTGKYWMACLKFTTKTPGRHWEPIADCLSRAFKPGEHAWMDPVTKRIVLAEDCTNPVDKPEIPEKCAYINFYAKVEEGDSSARIKEYGPTDLADETVCTPALKRAGEANWEYPWMDECPSVWCNFEDVDARIPEKGWRTSSFRLRKSGMYTLRLPPKVAKELEGQLRPDGKKHAYRVVFCIEKTRDPGPSMATYQGLTTEAQRLLDEEDRLTTKYARPKLLTDIEDEALRRVSDEDSLPSAFGRIQGRDMYNQPALAEGIYGADNPQVKDFNKRVLTYDVRAIEWNREAIAWNALHSCSTQVQWYDYVPQPDGSLIATIRHSRSDAQKANDKDGLGRPRTANWWEYDRTVCQ